MSEIVHSPLQERHLAAGATFAEFGGWLMPLEYRGVLAEHQAVRSAVGVFDVSHLGKIWVKGPAAVDHLNTVLTNDLASLGPGQAQYTLACTPEGGVVDDLIAYVLAPDSVLLVPNAANCAAVCALVAQDAPEGLDVVNAHREYAIIAVQGPMADQVMTASRLLPVPDGLDYMHCAVLERDGEPVTVCRTGYTGERGYELVMPNVVAGLVWDELVGWRSDAAAATPCGLGARDTLRLEMGYPLHGHDISPEINPVEAGLSWAIGWSKPSFAGAERLREIRAAGPARRLRGLRAVGRSIPRDGMAVVDDAGTQIGEVTSGTFSPTLRQGIALALLPATVSKGAQVEVQVRSRIEPFEVVSVPFVPSHVRDPAPPNGPL